MWILDETNTTEITAADVKKDDIVLFDANALGTHGYYVRGTSNGRTAGNRYFEHSGGRTNYPASHKMRRLIKGVPHKNANR